MKPQILIILLCVLLTVQAMAQSENKTKTLLKDKKPTTQKPISKPIQPIGADAKLMMSQYKEPETSFAATENNLKFKMPALYYGNNAIFPFQKKMFFYVERNQKQYLNLASYNLAYLALGWRFNSNLNVTGGLLAIKQFSNHLPYGTDRSGVRFNLNYSITNQLDFNMWGQYITGSSMNFPPDNLFPQTGTGVSMVLDLGGGSQFGVGAEYQRDDKKEKWNYNAGSKLKLSF